MQIKRIEDLTDAIPEIITQDRVQIHRRTHSGSIYLSSPHDKHPKHPQSGLLLINIFFISFYKLLDGSLPLRCIIE